MATDEEMRKHAIKAIKRKREFWTHVVAYCIINAFLIVIWYMNGQGLLLARMGARRVGHRPRLQRLGRLRARQSRDQRGRDPARDRPAAPRLRRVPAAAPRSGQLPTVLPSERWPTSE